TVDELVVVPLPAEPVGNAILLDVVVTFTVLPVAEVGVAERVAQEGDHPLLGLDLALADAAHAAASGFTSRTRPVRSCCIMPCLIARVLSRRASSAAISASMSERTVAMADCSSFGGSERQTCASA